MATLTRRDFRVIIYDNFSRGSSKADCFKEMSKVFGEDCPPVRTGERWYLQFWRGNFFLEFQSHTGCSSIVATPESVDVVRKAITSLANPPTA